MTGKQIRKRRKALNMSVEELAIELKVSANTVYRWERGFHKPHRVFVEILKRELSRGSGLQRFYRETYGEKSGCI